MSYVTVPEIAARIGRALTDLEAAQVNAWIDDLDAMISLRVPDLEDRVAQDQPSVAVVRMVYAQAIRRVLLNPEGLRQYTESIDDYSVTKTVDSAMSSSALYLTDDEWGLLSPASTGDAFTIRSHGATDPYGDWRDTTTWVPQQ